MAKPVDPLFGSNDSGTPLSPEEREGLKLTHITLRRDLNEAEQQNILRATAWAFSRRRDVLSVDFLCGLHRRMFGDVWRWAGTYRQTAKNIGIEAWRISTELRSLIDDVQYWLENETFTADEMAARFHFRLVWIHPFPNGNGRFGRLAADLLINRLGQPPLTWGSGSLVDAGDLRMTYIKALRAADGHDYGPLIRFIRS
jgi:Fic-DOC domain mobile mystery protein B